MRALTDEQLFTAWKRNSNNLIINTEVKRRQEAATGEKCEQCGHTKVWTGLITSCGCIDWND
jgi:hypothetical protein